MAYKWLKRRTSASVCIIYAGMSFIKYTSCDARAAVALVRIDIACHFEPGFIG